MKKFLFLLFAIANLSNAATVQADTLKDIVNRGTLVVGTESNYYPFEFTSDHGTIIGFDMDIAKRMAKAMGVKLEIVNSSVDSMIPGLVTKKFDIFMRGITLTPKRNLQVNFANPYFEAGQTILIRKEIAEEIKTYRDLNNAKYKLVSKIGTTGEMSAKKFMPKAKYISFDTEPEAVMEVVAGRADAFIFDAPYNAVAVQKMGQDKLVHLDQAFTYEPLAWAVAKDNANFINWLNHFLNQIQKDGTYDRLYNKWFVKFGAASD